MSTAISETALLSLRSCGLLRAINFGRRWRRSRMFRSPKPRAGGQAIARAIHCIGGAIRAPNAARRAGHVGSNAGCTPCDAVLRHGTVVQE